jgi:hypothetical protein
MSSQGIMSGKETCNNPGMHPTEEQNLALVPRKGPKINSRACVSVSKWDTSMYVRGSQAHQVQHTAKVPTTQKGVRIPQQESTVTVQPASIPPNKQQNATSTPENKVRPIHHVQLRLNHVHHCK